jgi:uncharacterized protein (TIGR02271 family)
MITEEQARELIGRDLTTESGEKIGRIGQIFLDDETGRPEWVTVHTGLFGTSESFVPLTDANVGDAGLTVPYDKSRIKDAPNIDVDAGHLSREEEAQLYEYYGLSYSSSSSDSLYADQGQQGSGLESTSGLESSSGFATSGLSESSNQGGMDWQTSGLASGDTNADFGGTTPGLGSDLDTGIVGHDTSGPTTDNAMTRSEERLNVGTESVETGRARLRKYIVTENVTTTVPVSREEVRIEREPITDANIGNAMSGPDLSEEEHEVVLHAEQPVINKDVTPVERVRLDTQTVTDTTTVQDSVRKEEIEMVDDTNTNNDLR